MFIQTDIWVIIKEYFVEFNPIDLEKTCKQLKTSKFEFEVENGESKSMVLVINGLISQRFRNMILLYMNRGKVSDGYLIKYYLTSLVRRKLVFREKRGVYQLTQNGYYIVRKFINFYNIKNIVEIQERMKTEEFNTKESIVLNRLIPQ